MRKGDLVRRVRKSEESFYDELNIDSIAVVVRGPYEKNIADIAYNQSPWNPDRRRPKFTVLKRVVDLMYENKIHKYCIADDYERERS